MTDNIYNFTSSVTFQAYLTLIISFSASHSAPSPPIRRPPRGRNPRIKVVVNRPTSHSNWRGCGVRQNCVECDEVLASILKRQGMLHPLPYVLGASSIFHLS